MPTAPSSDPAAEARIRDLARIDLFAGLTGEDLLCSIEGETVCYASGDRVFSEGDPVQGFMVILEGTLEIFRVIKGRRVSINEFTEGMTGGEVPLLSGTPHLAHAEAVGDLKVFFMEPEAFWRMLGSCAAVRERILANMSERNAQLQIVSFQREKLVSLGTMSAGLAHELNNPASAAARSAQALAEGIEDFDRRASSILQRYIFRQPVDAEYAFEEIQAQVKKPRSRGSNLLGQADAEDALLDWFEEAEIELGNPDEVAESLAGAGFRVETLRRVAERLIEREVGSFLRWVATEIELRQLAGELVASTERMSNLVRAMKGYSFMDQDDRARPIDLGAGLENTLVILAHKARKKELRFVRELPEELPTIVGFGGELNQVWTNLLDNAIHASPRSGTITLRAEALSGERVAVEVEDEGAGISDEVRERIFEPFFTTKDAGEGSGLGLDISYRIVVERHGGTIGVESEPGRTVFRVVLPEQAEATR